ncbi:MAG: hypothetical protein K0Q59_3321 [Paenibacillus sp.]|jgi:tetratricopeptide (TPR) repeat protein|nr:hypothetical protein [Paenibacillus sp.]
MFRNDYVMRLIEQLSGVLGSIIGLKKQKKPQEAIELVGDTYRRMFGLHPSIIRKLADRDLVELISRGQEAPSAKVYAVATLIKEEAELSAMMDNEPDSFRLYVKALNLLLMTAVDPTAIRLPEADATIDELLKRLSAYKLPPDTKQWLWEYDFTDGKYADGEDILFELLDDASDLEFSQADREGLLEQAIAYYERLLELDEATLAAGRLPLDEVQTSLAELKQRLSASIS